MENKKVFINAIPKKYFLQLFILVSIAFLFSYFLGPAKYNLLVFFIFFAILYLSIVVLNVQKWFFKIETDDTGISYSGIEPLPYVPSLPSPHIKKVRVSWDAIVSIGYESDWYWPRHYFVIVRTRQDSFHFPLSVKEQNKDYPKLRGLWNLKTRWKWIDESGSEEELTLENCPLYIEMQKHLNLSGQQILIKKEEKKLASKKPIYVALIIAFIFASVGYSIMLMLGYPERTLNTILQIILYTIFFVTAFVLIGKYQKK